MQPCSVTAAAEPLVGTAPVASAWLVLEQPGPWGPKALSDSHLDPAVQQLLSTFADHGVRVLLARHRDRPERASLPTRHMWLSSVLPGRNRVVHREIGVTDLALTIDQLNPVAIAAGDLSSLAGSECSPVVFVCAHGARDACCATIGRPVLTQALDHVEDPLRIWECSHVGGHRFAPVALCLPSGAVLGRATPRALVRASGGDIDPECLRGLSGLSPEHQAAVCAVARSTSGLAWLDSTCADDGRGVVTVTAGGGTIVRVAVTQQVLSARPESCGGEPVGGFAWVAEVLEP